MPILETFNFTPYGTGTNSGTVTSVGLSSSTLNISGSPITSSGTITADLPTQSGLTPGTYSSAVITVDAYGRLTAAANGGASVSSVDVQPTGTYAAALTSSNGPITGSGTIYLQPNIFTATTPGVVPLSGGGTTNFLRADGTWAAVGGGSGTVTTFSAATSGTYAGALSLNVANPTTTPALTITPNIFTNTTPGVVAGSGGGTTNFLRADGTWAAPTGSVTSVGVSGSNGIGVSGSPITTSGTIALSLGNITPTGITTSNVISGSVTASPAYAYGTLGFSDTNMPLSLQGSVNNYLQAILQNTSNGTTASTDIVVNNNLGTATTYYGNFGMNSSGFTGSGSLNAASAVYLTATSGDLVIGTTTSNQIRFVIAGGTTDAFGINTSGALLVAGAAGSTGQIMVSQGSSAHPIWSAYALSGTSAQTYTFPSATDTIAGIAATQTLTNKRITARVLSLSANSATPAINTDSYDVVEITAQTAAITSFTTNLTGTPNSNDTLIVNITGTASVALTWGTAFEAGDSGLPTTTNGTNKLTVGFLYNSATSKWRCMSGGSISNTAISNTRITQRVLALSANSATPAINTDMYDVVHITAQTAAITSFTTNLTGTPVDGDKLRISITGTAAVALTWGTSFEASTVALPTTTVTTARLDIGFFWNTETSKWRCVAVA